MVWLPPLPPHKHTHTHTLLREFPTADSESEISPSQDFQTTLNPPPLPPLPLPSSPSFSLSSLKSPPLTLTQQAGGHVKEEKGREEEEDENRNADHRC